MKKFAALLLLATQAFAQTDWLHDTRIVPIQVEEQAYWRAHDESEAIRLMLRDISDAQHHRVDARTRRRIAELARKIEAEP